MTENQATQRRAVIEIFDDMETKILELQTSRELQCIIYEKYEQTDKDTFQKLYDYEQIGILTHVLYDRFFEEVKALSDLYYELFNTMNPLQSGEKVTD